MTSRDVDRYANRILINEVLLVITKKQHYHRVCINYEVHNKLLLYGT